jgi:outer membrane protein, heavy metal efflux system
MLDQTNNWRYTMRWGLSFFIIFLVICLIANAQGSTRSISSATIAETTAAPPVDDLIREALRNNPSLQSMQSRIRAAGEMISPEGALPDPMLEIMMQDVNFPTITVGDAEMSMVGAQVTQSIPFPGKLQAKKETAKARQKVVISQREELRRILIKNIRSAYAQLYAIDKEEKALGYGKELQDMLNATVSMRYSAGEAKQEDVIKTQLQLSRLQERSIDLAAEREKVTAALNRLLDRPGDLILGTVTSLPYPMDSSAEIHETTFEHASELHTKQREIDAAACQVQASELELYPNFSVGMGFFSRGGFDQVVTLQVGVELPLWRKYKQRPLLRASQYELEAAKQDYQDMQAQVRSELSQLRAEKNRIDRQIHLLQEAILPQTSAALDSARSSYLAGQGDYSTVIEDFNLWLDARVQLERLIADRYSTWAEIESFTSSSVPNDNEEPQP